MPTVHATRGIRFKPVLLELLGPGSLVLANSGKSRSISRRSFSMRPRPTPGERWRESTAEKCGLICIMRLSQVESTRTPGVSEIFDGGPSHFAFILLQRGYLLHSRRTPLITMSVYTAKFLRLNSGDVSKYSTEAHGEVLGKNSRPLSTPYLRSTCLSIEHV